MPIETIGLSYTYATGTPYASNALCSLSLKIEDGDFIGIMGKTGCGKSTLIQLIAGLLIPSEGLVLLDGEDINDKKFDRSSLRKRIGVVFQYPEMQLFETTVAKDLAFGLRHLGLSTVKTESSVRKALALLGFDYDSVKDMSPLGFSGGEKRRLAIAGVLAVQPDILILDEPIAGLDSTGRDDFLQLIDRLNRQGCTVLMISHDADVLAEHAKRILVLKDGVLLWDGPPERVLSDSGALSADGIGLGGVREIVELLRLRGTELPPDTVSYERLLSELTARYGRETK